MRGRILECAHAARARARGRFVVGALMVLALAAACRRAAPEAPPQPKSAPGVIEVLKGGRWLFTYVEPAGTFATTDKPEAVPEGSRALVRVFDPSDPGKTDAPRDRSTITDLNQLLKSGKAAAKALSRDAFETAALAQLPPGESSPLAGRGPGAAEPPPPLPPPLAGDGGVTAGGAPVVTIYGTSWCGACRAAREYLTQRRVPFADKDIERDRSRGAARSLNEAVRARSGSPPTGAPIIERCVAILLQGFDQARIDMLVEADATMKAARAVAHGTAAAVLCVGGGGTRGAAGRGAAHRRARRRARGRRHGLGHDRGHARLLRSKKGRGAGLRDWRQAAGLRSVGKLHAIHRRWRALRDAHARSCSA